MNGGDALPPAAYALALAALPVMHPRRLLAVLRRWPPAQAWAEVVARRATADAAVAPTCQPSPDEVGRRWAGAAAGTDVAGAWASATEAGIDVTVLGEAGYPPVLSDDQEPPAVLFSRGDRASLEGPCVAIVGTRRCSRYGKDVAGELGRDLASAGVGVVSGLALGIDAAAHLGALDAAAAPPVGVVGSGLDVVYPRRHARLWADVAAAGVLVGEAPLGAAPEPWRFPARNRIIAALAHVVVVVESHARGGSMHTVDAALARDVPVMAVPGSVRSPASAGTNHLLAQGSAPARDATDVLVALDLCGARPRPRAPREAPAPDGDQRKLLDALGWEPATAEHLTGRTGLAPAAVAVGLTLLERDGWVVGRAGWWERVALTRRQERPLPRHDGEEA